MFKKKINPESALDSEYFCLNMFKLGIYWIRTLGTKYGSHYSKLFIGHICIFMSIDEEKIDPNLTFIGIYFLHVETSDTIENLCKTQEKFH